VEEEPTQPKSDFDSDSEVDSAEEEANENEKKTNSRLIEPQPDVVNEAKRKSAAVKEEGPVYKSKQEMKRRSKCHKKDVAGEVKVTGLRKLVEVYQEDFDDDLVDDEGHRSLEKKGNCTVIQEANTKLNAQFGKYSVLTTGNLNTIYSKEKCDDSMTTPPYLNVLTSLPCQTELMGGSTHAEGALQELEHPHYNGVKDELVLPSKDNRIILLKLQTIRIARLKATELTSVSNI
jgi:hypothetical protein